MQYQQNSNKRILVIGDKNLSSWSMRPWLALRAANIAFDEKSITLDLPDTSEKIQQFSPAGKVPVLIDGAVTVWDSLSICEYASELSSGYSLWPDARDKRAYARSVVAEMHSGFSALRQQLSMDVRLRMEVNHLTSGTVSDIKRILGIWGNCLANSNGPYLFGNTFTIPDAFYAPVVLRFISYGIVCKDSKIVKYIETIHQNPHVQEWKAGAEKETTAKQIFS